MKRRFLETISEEEEEDDDYDDGGGRGGRLIRARSPPPRAKVLSLKKFLDSQRTDSEEEEEEKVKEENLGRGEDRTLVLTRPRCLSMFRKRSRRHVSRNSAVIEDAKQQQSDAQRQRQCLEDTKTVWFTTDVFGKVCFGNGFKIQI